MSYLFYIADVLLPVTPSAVTIKTPSRNTTVDLMNDTQINILREGGLQEISFEFLLPHQKYPFSNVHFSGHTATPYIRLLNALKKEKKAFKFKIVRTSNRDVPLWYTNMLVQVEDFEFEEDADAHGLDVMCKLTLKEWKPYATKRLKKNSDGFFKTLFTFEVERTTDNAPVKVERRVVQENDSVWNIVRKHYGQEMDMEQVLKINNMAHPMDYKVGQELILPASTSGSNKNKIIWNMDDLIRSAETTLNVTDTINAKMDAKIKGNIVTKTLSDVVSNGVVDGATKKLDNLAKNLNLNILKDTVSPDKLLKKLDNLVDYTVSRVGDAVTGKVIQKLDRLESYVVTAVYKKVNSILEKIDGKNDHDVDAAVMEILKKLNTNKAKPITENDVDVAVREVLDKLNVKK